MNYKEALEVLGHHKPSERYTMLIEALETLKEYAKLGRATECAMKDGSKHTVFNSDVDKVIKFYEREYEDKE